VPHIYTYKKKNLFYKSVFTTFIGAILYFVTHEITKDISEVIFHSTSKNPKQMCIYVYGVALMCPCRSFPWEHCTYRAFRFL